MTDKFLYSSFNNPLSSQALKTSALITQCPPNKSLSRNKETTMFNAITQIGVSNTNTWSKRENNWFDIEEKLIFKNNVSNHADGDAKAVDEWIRLITKL